MAAPDIVCVEVRDDSVQWGAIQTVSPADTGAYDTWLTRTNPATGSSDKAVAIGPTKTHLRFQDVRSTNYLDRTSADVAANYGTIGGLTVTNVYRDTKPYISGLCAGALNVFHTGATSSKHFIFTV